MKRFTFTGMGIWAMLLWSLNCNRSFDNPSDSMSSRYTKKSEASIRVVGNGPFYQFDTVSFFGGVSSESVEEAELVRRYAWDFGDNGSIDTVLGSADTLSIVIPTAGLWSVSVRLTDDLGYTSTDAATITVVPRFDPELILPDIPDIHLSLDTSCAFYSQNEHTIKPVLLLGRYLTYKNKTESMALGNFVFEFLKNLTGTIDYNSLAHPYDMSFDDGIYTIDNGDLRMSAAFLYGSAGGGHDENDTIRHDLFDPRSYVRSFNFTNREPFYSSEPGPLWDLTRGLDIDVSNPLRPTMELDIALSELKFSGVRRIESRYTLSTQMNDTGRIAFPTMDAVVFGYRGLARIHPVRIRDIDSLVTHDRLEIDMSGSVIESDSFAMTFTLTEEEETTQVSYDVQLTQQMLEQLVRFGTGGGERKVSGDYVARSRLSVADLSLIASYFSGAYSTTETDTARFFCDRDMSLPFGTLFFDTPEVGYFTFVSQRYNYGFEMREGTVLSE